MCRDSRWQSLVHLRSRRKLDGFSLVSEWAGQWGKLSGTRYCKILKSLKCFKQWGGVVRETFKSILKFLLFCGTELRKNQCGNGETGEQTQDSVMCSIVMTPDSGLVWSHNNGKEQCLEIKYISVEITSKGEGGTGNTTNFRLVLLT